MVTSARKVFIVSFLQTLMQVKLLKEVAVLIAGNPASSIIDLLHGKKNVNEFVIAKKLKLNINQARNILYKLAERGIISFIRKKDRKNGGWYTYYWTLDVGKALNVLKSTFEQELSALEGQLSSRRRDRFYVCKNCDSELGEEQALLNNFTCAECGEVLELRDNQDLVVKLEGDITRHKNQLAALGEELLQVQHKETSLRMRKKKAELKKKKAERERKKKETIRLKKTDQKSSKSRVSKRASSKSSRS
jgi:transcription factor E